MSHTIKIAVLSAIALLGLEAAVPTPVQASPVLVQSARMQQAVERSRRRSAQRAEERRAAEEDARMAAEAEAEAEAARRAQADAQAAAQRQPTTVVPAAEPADAASQDTKDAADTPAPQI